MVMDFLLLGLRAFYPNFAAIFGEFQSVRNKVLDDLDVSPAVTVDISDEIFIAEIYFNIFGGGHVLNLFNWVFYSFD